METALLALVALVVGFFCGCTSIGGILLIPGIVLFSHLGIHEAMATSLFSFAIMAMLGTYLHGRKGSIRVREALAISLGALASGVVGAFANAAFSAQALNLVLAILILFAGISTLKSGQRPLCDVTGTSQRAQFFILLSLGLMVGFMSGLTGIGGPVLSVPFMIAMGFAPIVAVAVAQPLQLVAGISGSIVFMANGSVDYLLAAWITALELAGFYFGLRLAYSMKAKTLKVCISALCIATSLYLFVR